MSELKRKLAEWADCKFDPEWMPYHSNGNLYCDTKGNIIEYPPNFPESLDACDKWLMPKLKYYHMDNQNKPEHWAMVSIDGIHHRDSYGETPALALCLAIEKLIDKEEPNEGDKNPTQTT